MDLIETFNIYKFEDCSDCSLCSYYTKAAEARNRKLFYNENGAFYLKT